MTDRPLEFIFGLHFHQPVGNFKWVLENAYTQAYRPLIDAFKKYENLKLSLHISSPLLEFFKKEHPDFLQDICREIEKEKIEMLGGCFYEPILVSIPRRDILGQLKKTEHFLSDYMNTSSRGIWLAERVWEPHIPSLLKDSGAEYLAVDDTHFIQAGFTPSKLKGYYMSEDAGNKLGVFIINKELRYYIPFKPVDEIMDKFRDFSNRYDNPLLGMLDDGEKFGFWPKTKEWVHGQGWLDKFFKALNENSSWLKMRTLSEYYDKNRPLGRAYLPACQYYEMLEWAMPVEGSLKVKALKEKLDEAGMLNETDPYITGGMWKNFFHKYPESNYANKKMLYLSSLLHENKNAFTDSQEFEEARDCLYRSQCNCAYWHGVFGGIYLPHLRRAIHSNLIKVSSILDKILYEEKFCNYSLFDIDCDGSDEILVNTDSLFLCFSPSKGGMIEDLSDKIAQVNHLDTVARREEEYHSQIKKKENKKNENKDSEGIESIHELNKGDSGKFINHLNFDQYMRKSFIAHVMPRGKNLEDFMQSKHSPYLKADTAFSYEVSEKDSGVNIEMKNKDSSFIEILKSFRIEKGKRSLSCRTHLRNNTDSAVSFSYGTEFNFALLSDKTEEKKYIIGDNIKALSEKGSAEDIDSFGVIDEQDNYKVQIKLDKKCRLMYFPLKVVANSEGGFELSYQSSCMTPVFDIKLEPGEKFSFNLIYNILPC